MHSIANKRPRGSSRILVVDDGGEIAELVARDLIERGYGAMATNSGREALRLLRTQRFDGLVTDFNMPEVDGLMLLRESLALDPTRPVILMTAFGAASTAVEATGDGAYHFLTKPFRPEVLARLFEQAFKSG